MVKFDQKAYDVDGDGKMNESEIQSADAALEVELKEEKADSQRRMAWIAMISILVVTIIILMPFFPEERLPLVSDILSMFYIAQAGIVGAYFGMTAWMNR